MANLRNQLLFIKRNATLGSLREVRVHYFNLRIVSDVQPSTDIYLTHSFQEFLK